MVFLTSFPFRLHAPCLCFCTCIFFAVAGKAELAHGASPEPSDIAQLIERLGDERWLERQAAFQGLLEVGPTAVPLLEEASRSKNLEVAFRARDLLEQIDPLVIDFQIVRVRTTTPDAPSRIMSLAHGTHGLATNDPEGKVDAILLPGCPPRTVARSFVVSHQRAPSGRVDLQVFERQGRSGRGATQELYKPLSNPRCISLIKRSEESVVTHHGTRIQRERHRFLTLLVVEQRRKTSPQAATLPHDPIEARQLLLAALERQAMGRGESHPDDKTPLDERLAAVEILADIAPSKTSPVFEAALHIPALWPAAALGIGEPELLKEVVGAGLPDEKLREDLTPSAQHVEEVVRPLAAARLLEQGAPGGTQFLLDILRQGQPTQLHFAMATLSDYLRTHSLSAEERKEVLTVILGEDFLGRAVWQDEETRFLVQTALDLLRQDEPADRERAASLQKTAEKLASGELGLNPVSFDTCLKLWNQAQAVVQPTTSREVDLILRLIPRLSRKGQLTRTQRTFQSTLRNHVEDGSVPIEDVLAAFRKHFASDQRELVNDTLALLVGFAKQLSMKPQWLRPVTETLLTGGTRFAEIHADGSDARSTSSLFNRLERELQRWTVVRQSTKAPEDARYGAMWRTWLGDSAKVGVREAELEAASSETWKSGPVTLYSFVLLSRAPLEEATVAEAASESTTLESPPTFQVLDGRSFKLSRPGMLRYEDSWGFSRRIKTTSFTVQGSRTTLLLEADGTTLSLQGDQPVLRSLYNPGFLPRAYETSDLRLGSHLLADKQTPTYMRLYLMSARRNPEESALEGEALWQWILHERLLSVPEDSNGAVENSVVTTLTKLHVKEVRPFLRRMFDREPTPTRARQLFDLGDESTLDYLKKMLARENDPARNQAATMLAELGHADGAKALVETLKSNAGKRTNRDYQHIKALDDFLQQAPADAPERADIIEILLTRLSHPNWQYRVFRVLQREAKNDPDFGYDAARRLNDETERQEAIAKAVQRARDWWAASQPADAPEVSKEDVPKEGPPKERK